VWVQVPTGTLSNAEGNSVGGAGGLAVPTTIGQFTWRNAGQWNLAEGQHTIRVSMRESGAAVDAVRLERFSAPLAALSDAGNAAAVDQALVELTSVRRRRR
jgi:hypothetical protein